MCWGIWGERARGGEEGVAGREGGYLKYHGRKALGWTGCIISTVLR